MNPIPQTVSGFFSPARFRRVHWVQWWALGLCLCLLGFNQFYRLYRYKTYPKEQIDAAFKPIVEKYGIEIVYEINEGFLSPLESPIIPAGPPRDSKVVPIRHRVLLDFPDSLEKALGRYPVHVIKKYMKSIHFAGEIEHAGFKYAGSYDPFRRIIFLVSDGWSDESFPIGTFHHEFSSLLLKRHSMLLNPWFNQNPMNFRYLYDTDRDMLEIYDSVSSTGTEKDYEKGFMSSYGQTDFENDFNEYSKMIFTFPQKFKQIMDRHPRVRGKFLVWLKFYREIDPVFTEEYLFGEK